jgi:uncharacterized protein YdaT
LRALQHTPYDRIDKLIYIACPFWNDQDSVRDYRRKKAIDYSTVLIKKGYLVYSPLIYTERFAKDKTKEGYWIKHGIKMVEVCNEMRVLCLEGWQESKGVQGEIEKAKELNIKIKYIEKHARLAFHGSRTLGNKMTRKVIEFEIEKHQPEIIVTHGEPRGVCRLSKTIAQEQGLCLNLHHVQVKYATGKFHRRSLAVISDSDHCIFIHDGISQGTQNELALAKKLKAPYTYYRLENDELIEQAKQEERFEGAILDDIEGIEDVDLTEIDLSDNFMKLE